MSTDIININRENMAQIIEDAPTALAQNTTSHDKCLEAGSALIARYNAEGMSDALDQDIAKYLERTKKTVKKMNEKRSGVTKLFDTIRNRYVAMENEIDPQRSGTIPARLQEFRNAYAAKKRDEAERQAKLRQLEQARQNARDQYAADVEASLRRQTSAAISEDVNLICQFIADLTTENYDATVQAIKNVPSATPKEWIGRFKIDAQRPGVLTAEEASIIAENVRIRITESLVEVYNINVLSARDEALDRLPSKRANLERLAKESQEAAERERQRMKEQEAAAAAERERQRLEKEEQERKAAEMAAKNREMANLFGEAQSQASASVPKMQVRKRIVILDAEGIAEVIGMWWSQVGCTMQVSDLEKAFSKQITYVNKIANEKKDPIFIKSPHVEYIDDVKAK